MELETLVREVLREHAAEAPTVVPELRSPSGRRWLYAGIAAAVVAGLAVGIAAIRGSDPAPPASTPLATSPRPVLSTPPGYTRVAYHGFTVAVPNRLPVLTNPCLPPARYVLAENPNAAYSCVSGGVDTAQQTLTVRLTAADSASDEITTAPTEIGGLPARIGYGTLDGYPGTAGEAVFPGQDLSVVVTAPDRATVEQILTSVRQGTDPNGCPADYPAPADPAADALVPGAPTTAVRCVYASTGTGYVLQASLPVHPGALADLVQAINALPASVPVALQPLFGTELLRFGYADGSYRTLRVDLSDPTTYSDGTRIGYDDNNVVTDRLRAATS